MNAPSKGEPPYVYSTHREYAKWRGMRAFLAWFRQSYPPNGRDIQRGVNRAVQWRAFIAGRRDALGSSSRFTLPPL